MCIIAGVPSASFCFPPNQPELDGWKDGGRKADRQEGKGRLGMNR